VIEPSLAAVASGARHSTTRRDNTAERSFSQILERLELGTASIISLVVEAKEMARQAAQPGFVPMLLEEDVVMRSLEFAPLFRSTIGFDRLLDTLPDIDNRPTWPPYNIERSGDDRYRITMAIAGYRPDEIEITQQGNTLIVTGRKAGNHHQRDMLHQGLAFRDFHQTFKLAAHVKVATADLSNGLLAIDLVREIPEELKPRRIEIGRQTNTFLYQDNPAAAVGADQGRQSKAA
jgi:molecular chaperone IbpA